MVEQIIIKKMFKEKVKEFLKGIADNFEKIGTDRDENYFRYRALIKPHKGKLTALLYNEDKELIATQDLGAQLDAQILNATEVPEHYKEQLEENLPSEVALEKMEGYIFCIYYDEECEMRYTRKHQDQKKAERFCPMDFINGLDLSELAEDFL